MNAETAAPALPVVLVRVPPPGGAGRDKLTPAERAGGLLLTLDGFYGRDVFDRYRRVAGELRFVANPTKGQVGDGPACARACAALQAAGFAVRAENADAAARLGAGASTVGAVVADADALLVRVCAALAARGLAPRPYQLDGIRWLRAMRAGTGAGALLDEMGLGKTMQTLLAFGDRILVIGPASVKGVWAREAALWRPDLVPVQLDGTKSNAGEGPICAGSPGQAAVLAGAARLEGPLVAGPVGPSASTKRDAKGSERCGERGKARDPGVLALTPPSCAELGEDLGPSVATPAPAPAASAECAGARPRRCSGSFRWPDAGEIVITNYDVVTADDVAAAGPCPVGVDAVADEGHVVKNGATGKAKAIKAAFAAVGASRGCRLLCTATPICNRPLELRAVLEAVGAFKAAFSSWTAFERAFGGAVRSAEALPTAEAAEALARVSLRRTKADVARDLPTLTIAERRVELEGKAAEIAAEIERRLRAQVEAAVAAAGGDPEEVAKAIEGALRAGSEIGEMSAARKVLALAKLPAALEVIEECEDAGRPIVFASAHREVCERVGSRPGWAMIVGGVEADERTRIVAAFQRGELKGIALTIKAGGVGLTLTAAADMVCADLEWNPALNDQLFARIHRIGQDRPCVVTLLRGDAWIEDRMAELLGHKARMISGTIGRVAELGGRIAAAPDMAAVIVGRPARPVEQPRHGQVGAMAERPLRSGWIRDPELAARVEAAAADLPGGHLAAWLRKVAGETGGDLPGKVRGQDTRGLVDACEAEAAEARRKGKITAEARAARARPAADAREAAAAAALAYLAGHDGDHAREQNGVGFAASTQHGHRLHAHLVHDGALTPEEWAEAVKIAVLHKGQVGELPAAGEG